MATELWKALTYLYPNARPLVDYELTDNSDGRGPRITAWRLPQAQPTEAELAAASAAYDAAQTQRDADAQALRQKVLTVAQSAVGQTIDNLTTAQVRALVAVLLWKAGALDKTGAVKPLGGWDV
ncbi:MAG TPA: XkdW family protein [Roseiflexaceae bacterium]|nr:XkdW family protein [Roseiflexaceae bacterium]